MGRLLDKRAELMKTIIMLFTILVLLCGMCSPVQPHDKQLSPLDLTTARRHHNHHDDARGKTNSNQRDPDNHNASILQTEKNYQENNTEENVTQRQEKIQLSLPRVHEDGKNQKTEGTEGNHTFFRGRENIKLRDKGNVKLQLIHRDTTKDCVRKPLLENARKGKSHQVPTSMASPKSVKTAGISAMPENPFRDRRSWDVFNRKKKKPVNRLPRQAPGVTYPIDGIMRNPIDITYCYCDPCMKEWIEHDTPSNIGANFENIAFGKRVFASDAYSQACAINNGMWSFNDSTFWKPVRVSAEQLCFVAKRPKQSPTKPISQQLPYIEVDLGSVITMKEFTLIREMHVLNEYYELLNIQVLVDGKICYEFVRYVQGELPENYKDLPRVLNRQCDEALTGRYVRIRKAQMASNLKIYLHMLRFCELYIWICKLGYFGSSATGCKPCPSDCRFPCDNYQGCTSKFYNIAMYKEVYGMGSTNYMLNNGDPYYDIRECLDVTSRIALFRVQLGDCFFVHAFNIWALPRGASDSLEGFSIVVTEDRILPKYPYTTDQLCFEHSGEIQDGASVENNCNNVLQGKYVWVIRNDRLGFCELEVMGRYLHLLHLKSTCNKLELTKCDSKTICDNYLCKLKINEECEHDDECVQGSICESIPDPLYGFITKCKVDWGNPCKSGQCRTGSLCNVSAGRCKLDVGLNCKDKRDMCPTNTVCDDTLDQCRLGVGQKCNKTSQCTAGASCDQGECRCQDHSSERSGTQCQPKSSYIGSECSTADECLSDRCENGECVCKEGLELYPPGFACRWKAGTDCSAEKKCNTGMVCENGKCRIDIGGSCYANEQNCKSELKCDTEKNCKKDTDKSCSSSDECMWGHICSNGKCKIINGGNCRKSASCASEFCSSENKTCEIDVEQVCALEAAHMCRKGSFCEGTVCKWKFGHICTTDAQCQSGTVCSVRGSSKQCRWTLGHGCQQDEDCEEIAICDNQKQCKICKSGDCQKHPDQCLSGGLCSKGKCVCKPRVTLNETEKCNYKEKIVGGVCNPSRSIKDQECNDKHAYCNNETKCECEEGFIFDHISLECRIDFSSDCLATEIENTMAETPECISGAECDVEKGICTADVLSSCGEDKRRLCKSGTRCDVNSTCRLDLHGNCTNYPTGCRENTTCDILKRCKKSAGGSCKENNDCEAGFYCNHSILKCQCMAGVSELKDGKCVILDGKVGGKCKNSKCTDLSAACDQSSGECECKSGYVVDPLRGMSCAKSAGQTCKPTVNKGDDECKSGLVCDPVDCVCRVVVGKKCDGELKELCVTDSVCDYDSVCRLELGGNCNGDNHLFCKTGTLCDWIGRCSYRAGDSCSLDKNVCIAGAICFKSQCVCDTLISSPSGFICQPLPGRYKSSCDLFCKMEHSECVDGLCECVDGAAPNKQLDCDMPLPSLASAGFMTQIILSAAVGLALFCAVVGALVCSLRKKRKQGKLQEIREYAAESMARLRTLANSASSAQFDQVQTRETREGPVLSTSTRVDESIASTSFVEEESSTAPISTATSEMSTATAVTNEEISDAPTSNYAEEIYTAPTSIHE